MVNTGGEDGEIRPGKRHRQRRSLQSRSPGHEQQRRRLFWCFGDLEHTDRRGRALNTEGRKVDCLEVKGIDWVARPEDQNTDPIPSHIYGCSLTASVSFMVCISLERYLVIAWPLWYRLRRTIKISVVVCVLVWVVPLFYFLCSLLWRRREFLIPLYIFSLLPLPLLIFFLAGTLKALSASISVPADRKRRIVGMLVLVLLIYLLLFLPIINTHRKTQTKDKYYTTLDILSNVLVKFSPLADLVLYVFMRKGAIDKLLASVCCCRMDSNDVSGPAV
ncbi:ovarian cancer G-protein coupled receptor 1-like [Etheostoma cragini]|uniref:ovarian cancer G-protein coupled receptor 1-like n=1 Tax=Etheostoma cragini TaxID=417921 RepID=UPI00155E2BF3|nr:ovarian cancer G-protein coupled receptor 1-like [Etheostoma cragini]